VWDAIKRIWKRIRRGKRKPLADGNTAPKVVSNVDTKKAEPSFVSGRCSVAELPKGRTPQSYEAAVRDYDEDKVGTMQRLVRLGGCKWMLLRFGTDEIGIAAISGKTIIPFKTSRYADDASMAGCVAVLRKRMFL